MRRALLLGLLLCLGLILLPSAARASTAAAHFKRSTVKAAEEQPMVSLAALRTQAKMAPLPINQDAALNDLLGKYISAIEALPAEEPTNEPSDLAYCRCYLWQGSGDNARFISPTEFAASQGLAGKYGAWALVDGANLDSMPEGQGEEFFLDQRLTGLAAREHTFSSGAKVFLVVGRLEDRRPYVRSISNPVNAYHSTTLAFTSPSTAKKFRIDLRYGNRWMEKYYGGESEGFDYYYGFEGLRLNYFAAANNDFDRVRLAWNARYRIVADGEVGEFDTLAVKPPRKSWLFEKSMKSGHRRIFLRAISKMKPSYRAVLRQIAPYTRIKTHAGSGASIAWPYNNQDSKSTEEHPFMVSFARGHLANRKFRNEVVAHELAHIIDFSGLDDIAYSQFLKTFKKSKKWRRCGPSHPPSASPTWPCIENMELIADQLAYGALNKRSGVGGYGDPRLTSSKVMMRLLKAHYYFVSPFEGKWLTSWDDDGEIGQIDPEEDRINSAQRKVQEQPIDQQPIVDSFPGANR